MFLLPSILLGILFALLVGGRPGRLLELELRHAWCVPTALGLQLALVWSSFGSSVPGEVGTVVHISSYGFLVFFAAANAGTKVLLPLFAGMAANAVAIVANGGKMPVSPEAARAAGIDVGEHSNVQLGGERLTFLGDVFALPHQVPFANVFSVGDLLIGVGMMALIVVISLGGGERSLVPRRILRPLAVPAFRRLALGKLISHFGDWLTLAALVGWIYDDTGSVSHVALLMLVRLAPPVLGGGLAAIVVDRLPRNRLLVQVEILRGIAVAGALAAVVSGSTTLAFVALAASGALAAISAATVPSLVPSLLGDEELPAANAALGIAQDAAMTLGALGAGVILATVGVQVALAVDFATFIVAALLYSRVRMPSAPIASAPEPREASLLAGLRYVVRKRILLVLIGAFASATIATGLTNASLPRFLEELGLGSEGYGFGLAALAAGLTLGQAVVGLARVGTGGGRWIGVALLVMSLLFVGLALTQHLWTAMLFLALIGFIDGTTDVLFDTIVQREADPRFYGRVFGLASAFFTTTMMGAVAAAPLVNRLADVHRVILFAALGLLVAGVVALLGSGLIRRRAVLAAIVPNVPDVPAEVAPVLELVPRLPAIDLASEPPMRVVVRLSDGSLVALESCASQDAAER
ncbi:MAG: MFS transporter [Gaiellaceae bacterium]